MSPSEPLLEVEDLYVEFKSHGRVVRPVNGVEFSLEAGETLGIVGETGSGKSVTASAIMGIVPDPPVGRVSGSVKLHGQDLSLLSRDERRRLRGSAISMVFQDALSALNPSFSIGWQIREMYRIHGGASGAESKSAAVDLLSRVGIASPRERLNSYPHEFSGGMRQRVMIAMSLALNPEVLIADEPTTALDVTVQAQVLALLTRLREESGMGVILITHDLGVVVDTAQKICVMYAGRVVESGPSVAVTSQPGHPYTRGLVEARRTSGAVKERLNAIPGAPPDAADIPSGCPFHPRCLFARPLCSEEVPALRTVAQGRRSACHFAEEVLDG